MGRIVETPVVYVPAGGIVTAKREAKTLVAVLGSCVAVALSDKKAGVGGLAHLLLPRGNGGFDPLRPGMFADPGLKVLLERVIGLGAEKESLEACVAGGGLIGPLTERDLRFDPGGRTVESVGRFLTGEGIPIRQFETGGYLGRRLDFSLLDLETTINPVVEVGEGEPLFATKPTEEEIMAVIGQIRPIPQIALNVIRLLGNGSYSWREIRDEVRKDQVIGARILHLCNSAMSGLREKVDAIDRALVLLGEKHLFHLIISAACEDYFLQHDQGYSLCRGGLYLHAVRTAALAERLAVLTKRCPPDLAYTGGLLHDIGKVVLDRLVAGIQPYFYRRIGGQGVPLVEVESEALGITHPQAGDILAKAWNLPPFLREVIRRHHEPRQAVLNPVLTNLVFLADLIMLRYQNGLDLEFFDGKEIPGALKKLGLTMADFPELIHLSLDLPV
ncbi:MAG: HDOD domain-containing protein [Pseudomonadota bacterium]